MMGRQEREMMGRDVLSGASFIGVAGDRVMIRFPRKRYLSVSTTHAIRHIIEEPKGWNLKDFKVCGIPEKEPLHNRF
jgi:hypothetical protein